MNKAVHVHLPRAVGMGEQLDMLLQHENETYSHRRIRACKCHSRRDTFTEYPIDVLRQDGIESSNRMDADGYFVTSIRCVGIPVSSLRLKFGLLTSCITSKFEKCFLTHPFEMQSDLVNISFPYSNCSIPVACAH